MKLSKRMDRAGIQFQPYHCMQSVWNALLWDILKRPIPVVVIIRAKIFRTPVGGLKLEAEKKIQNWIFEIWKLSTCPAMSRQVARLNAKPILCSLLNHGVTSTYHQYTIDSPIEIHHQSIRQWTQKMSQKILLNKHLK